MSSKKVDVVVVEEGNVNATSSIIHRRRKTYESFQEFSLHDHPPTSYLETMMHLLKGNIGTGVFAMADAMRNSGILLGPVLTVIIGVICVHAQHMLIKSADFLKAKNNLLTSPNFAETVEMSFLNSKSEKWKKWGPPMKLICNIFIVLTQLGFCSVYMLFVGKNLMDVFEHHNVVMDIHVWVTIGLVPILLTALIRTLKIIAICSTLANFCMGLGILLTIGFLSVDLPPLSDRDYVVNIDRLPFFFGIVLFTYEGIALVLPLKNAMKKPKYFSRLGGVLNVGMVIASIIYIAIGILGYWRYGEDTLGSITLNLDTSNILAQVIKLMVSLGVLLGYAIQFFVAIQIMFVPILDSSSFVAKYPITSELAFRSLMVLLTFFVAMVVPDLTLLLSLVGSVCSTVIAFVLPSMCELIISHSFENGIPFWCLVKNSVILLIALLGFSFGGVLSLKEIVEKFM